MRILVTGASGYIGGRLIPRLLDEGHEVVAFVRNPASLQGAPWLSDVSVAHGDLTDRARNDPRSKIIPFTLLFDQTFPLNEPLRILPTPRLLLPNPPNLPQLSLFLSTHLRS